jgi:hypothetical protein
MFSPSTPVSSAGRRADKTGPLVAVVPSGPNWTPPPTIPIKKMTRHDKPKQVRKHMCSAGTLSCSFNFA